MSFPVRSVSLIGVAALGALWSYYLMQSSSEDAISARNRLARCKNVADSIDQVRSALSSEEMLADRQFDPTPVLSKIFRESGAKVDGNFTVTVTPQPLADMPFTKTGLVIMPTQNLTLKQLVTLLEKLHANAVRFNVEKITLSAPRAGSGPAGPDSETWQADLEISFLEHASVP